MEQLFLILICSAALALAVYLYQKGRQQKVTTRVWIFGALGLFMITFGLAWCVTSFEEGEPFAGYMGILVFSGVGVLSGLLAYSRWKKDRPAKKTISMVVKKPVPVGIAAVIALLTVLGAILLPYAIGGNRFLNLFNSSEKLYAQIEKNVLSDRALPFFVKRVLAYETLYGEYPDNLEQRLMQSMASGIKDSEMKRLMDSILPKKERLSLLKRAIGSGVVWLDNKEPYPQLELQMALYTNRLMEKSEFLMDWLYKNFNFPVMDSIAVSKVNAGVYSEQMSDYMVTPPDSLKSGMIANGAIALQKQLDGIEIPGQMNMAAQIRPNLSESDAHKLKSQVNTLSAFLGWTWLLPIVLLMVAFGLTLWKLPEPMKYLGFILVTVSGVGLLVCDPLRDIPTTVHMLIQDLDDMAPSPALALLDRMAFETLKSTTFLLPMYNIILLVGLGLLLFAHRNGILRILQRFVIAPKRSMDKKDSTIEKA
ncbi:hypothetical protein L0P88_06970 [Muricauda sp. SCSIO 64092]|uniref:hypothetical protein n=1 Tax=Allomuricauda sp. SCSIO 64092 TaxID=2908842 RepID=UPI001FF6C869|nr:hypothetical protein [Muricauda sp. SCSIO 64092]UOY08288.1 hypothetical protein L0P88_06970 [Muricauda sp. SCSIO 64092]